MPEEISSGQGISWRHWASLFAIPFLVAARGVAAFLLVGERDRGMTFDGETTVLEATQIVPTLDTPMEKGKNVVWCASFLL